MYTLYYLPNTCSLATHVVLRELDLPLTLINKADIDDYSQINPVGVVPVLDDGKQLIREGAAIILHLLEQHHHAESTLSHFDKEQSRQDILFANATMHPAYSRLFFIDQYISDKGAKAQAFQAATDAINALWKIVDNTLYNQDFLGGNKPSAADIMLTVYSRWGIYFPVDITVGNSVQRMLDAVQQRPSFQASLSAES